MIKHEENGEFRIRNKELITTEPKHFSMLLPETNTILFNKSLNNKTSLGAFVRQSPTAVESCVKKTT